MVKQGVSPTSDVRNKRRSSTKKKKFYTEEHFICDGNVKIVRTKQSGRFYQMIMWIQDEKRHYKQSLRETDLEISKEKGRQIFYSLMGKKNIGQKIFTITFGELVEKYLVNQKERSLNGVITEGRYITIRSIMGHLLDFVGKNSKVDSVRNTKFREYFDFRRNKSKNKVQDVTLRNERSQIQHLYKWGTNEGFVNINQQIQFNELKKVEVRTRNYLKLDHYKILYNYLEDWMNDKTFSKREVYERRLIRDFILVLSNTGMRVGEGRQIKWGMVDYIQSKKKNKKILVEIRLPSEITKTRKKRSCIGRRGDVLKRIRKYSNFVKPDDYVFSDYENPDQPISKDKLYKYWKIIMNESGLGQIDKSYSYYSLRHTFITYRLIYGDINVFLLSGITGTSVQNIKDHYFHPEYKKMSEYLMRDKSTTDESEDMFGGDYKEVIDSQNIRF